MSGGTGRSGYLGVALVPGAGEVLDRSTGALVPCTAQLCSDTATVVAEEGGHQVQKTMYFNRAPFYTREATSVSLIEARDSTYMQVRPIHYVVQQRVCEHDGGQHGLRSVTSFE